jgi:predicted nucleic acid-binding protein
MIISDATAIIVLINIDCFEILETFKTPIIVTSEVYNEVTSHAYGKKIVDEKIKNHVIRIQNAHNKAFQNELTILLDSGEASSIALALETKYPLIIDEKKGRKIAQSFGVKILGVVGILKFLYQNNTHTKEKTIEIIERLKGSDFRIDGKLLELILN